MAINKRRIGVAAGLLFGVGILTYLLWPQPIVEYGAGARGFVVDTRGNPIAGATVTLDFEQTVFDAITPLRKARLLTDEAGHFQDFFISCNRPGGPYTVTVDKPGFHRATVRGVGMGSHRIVLRDSVQLPTTARAGGAG